MSLAHAQSALDEAYMRGELLNKRRQLMGAWADYLEGAKVLALADGRRAARGASPVRPRGEAPACFAADRPSGRAGDFHRYPASRRNRQRAARGDRTCHRAARLRTSDPARLARRRWVAVACSSAQSRRHRAETPAMLSRRGSAIARESD